MTDQVRSRGRHLLLAALLAALCTAPVYAQNPPVGVPGPAGPGRIAGLVVGADAQPLNAVAVTVRSLADTSMITGAMTGRDGRFRLEGLPLGKYRVHVSYIGYKPLDVPEVALTAASPAHDIGRVVLEVAPVALPGLDATAERSPIVLEADRTIYNTKEMPAAAGGTAADVLRHIDELEVDFNGRVTMAGNRPVAIHINGRPSPMKGEQLERFLTQLTGKMISKVEVMPNPSAKHDPDGMGGIVNIVLKDDVSLGLSGSFGVNTDTRGNRGLSTRLAYQHGRLTFFGGGSGSVGDNESTSRDLRQNLLSTPVTFFEQNGLSANESLFAFGDFSAELKLAKQTILWANGYGSVNGHESRSSVHYDIYQEGDVPLDRYTRDVTSESDGRFHDVGIGLKHQFIPQRHELTADVRDNTNGYGTLMDALKLLEDPAADRELTAYDADNDNGALTFRVDYVRPWRTGGNVSAGVSLARRELDEHSLQNIFARETDPTPTSGTESAFVHEERIRSFYFTAAQAFWKFNVSAGVRGEFAATDFTLGSGERFGNDYNSVFPNFSVSYPVAKGRTLRVGYSKRVGRPPSYYLNPYRPTSDPLNRFEGNPNLKPNYTHSVTADFSWIGSHGTLRIAPYYNLTVDNWDQIRNVDEQGVSVTRVMNTASIRRIGSAFTLGLRPQGHIGGSIGFSLFHIRNDATNISADYERSAFRWSTNSNLNAKLTGALTATLNANYSPPRDMPQGRQNAFVFSSLGLRHQLFKQKATLNVYVNDPLDLMRFEFESSDRSFRQITKSVPKFRSASISLSYNFGKPPEQHSRRDQAETGQIQQ